MFTCETTVQAPKSAWTLLLGWLTGASGSQAPGFGDFTTTIGDHDIMGNPINPKPIFSIKDADSID